jgi:hypothetical protein
MLVALTCGYYLEFVISHDNASAQAIFFGVTLGPLAFIGPPISSLLVLCAAIMFQVRKRETRKRT